jgi:hypothetical protein
MKTTDIVIPLHNNGGFLGGDRELRYVLRSLCANYAGEFRVHVITEKLPDWLAGVEHVSAGGGPGPKLRLAGTLFPEGFLWWYDDMVLVRPQTEEDLKVTTARLVPGHYTKWGQMVNALLDKLRAEGHTAIDYSRAHGPYWYTGPEVAEGFATCVSNGDLRFPTETWILNLAKRKWRSDEGILAQYYKDFTPPGEDAIFVHWNDRGCSPGLVAWLDERFGTPCRFEVTPAEKQRREQWTARNHALGLR